MNLKSGVMSINISRKVMKSPSMNTRLIRSMTWMCAKISPPKKMANKIDAVLSPITIFICSERNSLMTAKLMAPYAKQNMEDATLKELVEGTRKRYKDFFKGVNFKTTMPAGYEQFSEGVCLEEKLLKIAYYAFYQTKSYHSILTTY